MADITAYVWTDNPGPTYDGTSHDNGYLSLAAAESQEESDHGNLVGGGNTMTIKCYGVTNADTTKVQFGTGWTTGASNDITITTDGEYAGGRNMGPAWSNSHYRLAPTSLSSNDSVFIMREDYITLENIQVAVNDTGNSAYGISGVNGATTLINIFNVRVGGTVTSGTSRGIYCNDTGTTTWNVVNCIVSGDFVYCYSDSASSTFNIYNCIAANTTYYGGRKYGSACYLYNSLFYNCTSNWLTEPTGGGNNATTKATADGLPSTNLVTSVSTTAGVDLVDGPNGDWRIVSGGALDDTGDDYPNSTSYDFDIVGHARS